MTRSRKRKLLLAAAWLLGLVVAVVLLAPLALRSQRVQAALERRLTAAVGRPVETGKFTLSLLGGPRLEAENVSVAEDPQFGYEDFIRAPRLTVAMRWRSLLAGRLEFGTLRLVRPSFNVVRAADGRWNLQTWLATGTSGGGKGDPRVAPTAVAGVTRVEIDEGRINLKFGADKHPFAVVDVEGFLERRDANAWQVDLRAVPMRAGTVVQEPGILEIRGVVRQPTPGASPADLSVQWTEASISDALRLAVGHDFGMRGAAVLEAQIRWPEPQPGAATEVIPGRGAYAGALTLAVRVAGVHRWDLPGRTADPALNLRVQADWVRPLVVHVVNGVLEAPGSNVRFSGWLSPGAQPPGTSLRVVSSAISLNDLFNWYRAFRPGVSDSVTVEGHSGVDLEIRGWPPRLQRAVMASNGAAVRFAAGAAPEDRLTMGRAELRFARDERRRESRLELQPVTLTFGDPRRESASSSVRTGTLRVDAAILPSKNWQAEWNVAGQTERSQHWWAAARALGIPQVSAWAAAGWATQGPAAVRLHWSGTAWPLNVTPSGSLDLSGATLHAPFLNQPARLGSARIEFTGGERRVNFSNARIFGTTWAGTLRARDGQPWEAALAAEQLNAAELDRWLNPAAAQGQRGILDQLRGGGGAGARRELPAGMRAEGRVSVAQFSLGALTLRRLRGNIQLETGRAWRVNLTGAQADFAGGAAEGSFVAEFDAANARPVYRAEVNLTGVNLATLAAASTRTARLFEGQLAGRVNISAAGAGRDALLGSLSTSGSAQIRNARTRLLDLSASLRAGELRRGASEFITASGEFGLDAEKKLQIASLRLTLPPSRAPVLPAVGGGATIRLIDEKPLASNQVDVTGNVEWFGLAETRLNLDIFVPNVTRAELAGGRPQSAGRGRIFNLRGTLAAPQLAPAGR